MTTNRRDDVRLQIPDLPDSPIYLAEHVFAKTWLPVFLSYFAGEDPGLITAWATNVAGNYYKEVHVVRNVESPGETLFVVPGLMNNDIKVFNKEITSIIPDVVERARLHNDAIPGSGDKYLLDMIVPATVPSMVQSEEEEAWKKIYRYYGIDAPFLHSGDNKSGITITEALIEGYDDDF